MWVNRGLYQLVLDDNLKLTDRVEALLLHTTAAEAEYLAAKVQKSKDDLTIEWMRHRVNALEKQNALMLAKVAGIYVPVPEIVPALAGVSSQQFDTMPTFEDIGDSESKRLGIQHDEDGSLVFTR